MTAREYLSRAGRVDPEYWKLVRRIQDLRMQMSPIGGISYDDVHVMTSPAKTSRTERQIIELVDAENDLAAELLKVVNKRRKIVAEIAALKDQRYIQILELRYVDGMGFMEIADTMKYSLDRTYHLHMEALNMFAEIYGLEKTTGKNKDNAQ